MKRELCHCGNPKFKGAKTCRECYERTGRRYGKRKPANEWAIDPDILAEIRAEKAAAAMSAVAYQERVYRVAIEARS